MEPEFGSGSSPTLATGFERFAISVTAGSFRIGPRGEPLFFWLRSDVAYVLPGRRRVKQLRTVIALLIALVAFALTSSTGGHASLFVLKLLTVSLPFLVTWLYVRRLPRTPAQYSAEKASRLRRAVMDRRLAIALLEVLCGWSILSAAAVPFRLDTAALVLVTIGVGLSADGVRLLFRREPLPPGVLSE